MGINTKSIIEKNKFSKKEGHRIISSKGLESRVITTNRENNIKIITNSPDQYKKLFYSPKNDKRIYFFTLSLKNKFFVIKYFIVHNNYYYNIFQKNKLNNVPEENKGFSILYRLLSTLNIRKMKRKSKIFRNVARFY